MLELERWPIIVLRVRNDTSPEQFQKVFGKYESEVFARRKRYVSITDLTELSRPPGARERRAMADWMRDKDPVMSRLAIANSNVSGSAVARGALKALYWVQKPNIPQATHSTLDEALDWARKLVAHHGI